MTGHNPWLDKARQSRDAANDARDALLAAADRCRLARAELGQARADRDELVAQIMAAGLLPKTEIATLAGVSRSRLYE